MSFNGSYGEARTAAGFLNLPSIAMEQNFEMRRKSVFGPLSQPIKGKTSASASGRWHSVSYSASTTSFCNATDAARAMAALRCEGEEGMTCHATTPLGV